MWVQQDNQVTDNNQHGGEVMRNNPDDLANQLVNKIKAWLKSEISDVHSHPHDDDVDSRELGILDGRYECARGLITQIKKWENE
tara:strand:- start:1194 stop:1445 length:252 start_codon:yes stop_codon:yes gene_type:complete